MAPSSTEHDSCRLYRGVLHIRSSPVRFPIARGHDFPEFENIVDENERYSVVQKKGVAAEEAAKLDPRSR